MTLVEAKTYPFSNMILYGVVLRCSFSCGSLRWRLSQKLQGVTFAQKAH